MTTSQIIRVVSLTLDKHTVTFFTEEADTVILKTGNPILADMIRQAALITAEGKVAEIDLSRLNTSFEKITKKTNGLVKFFTVARSKLAEFFGAKGDKAQAVEVVKIEEYLTQETTASPKEEETVVMVAEGMAVPNVEKLTPLVEAAVERDRTDGLTNLMARMARRSNTAAHSVQDLLTFLERADLPIADDGTILAYRVMNTYKKGVHTHGKYADCHTGEVCQDVGFVVEVPDHLVDMSRNQECSSGLHIARRSYLSSFSGDTLFLCAIAPEDILVVPHRDPNKVRVRRYTVLGKFSPEANKLVRDGKSITHLEADAGLIALAMRGELPPPHMKVEITGNRGTGLVYTPLGGEAKQVAYRPTDEDYAAAQAVEEQAKTSDKVVDIAEIRDIAEIGHAFTDEPEVVQEAEPEKEEAVAPVQAPLTHRQQIAAYVSEWAYAPASEQEAILKKMVSYKKTTKKGWAKLGVEDPDLLNLINNLKD